LSACEVEAAGEGMYETRRPSPLAPVLSTRFRRFSELTRQTRRTRNEVFQGSRRCHPRCHHQRQAIHHSRSTRLLGFSYRRAPHCPHEGFRKGRFRHVSTYPCSYVDTSRQEAWTKSWHLLIFSPRYRYCCRSRFQKDVADGWYPGLLQYVPLRPFTRVTLIFSPIQGIDRYPG